MKIYCYSDNVYMLCASFKLVVTIGHAVVTDARSRDRAALDLLKNGRHLFVKFAVMFLKCLETCLVFL